MLCAKEQYTYLHYKVILVGRMRLEDRNPGLTGQSFTTGSNLLTSDTSMYLPSLIDTLFFQNIGRQKFMLLSHSARFKDT